MKNEKEERKEDEYAYGHTRMTSGLRFCDERIARRITHIITLNVSR